MYKPSQRILDQNAKAFTYAPPKAGQPERYQQFRDKVRDLAGFAATNAPESRELSLALTKLEEAVMWFNAAIARNE